MRAVLLTLALVSALGCATTHVQEGPAEPLACAPLAWDDCGRTAGCRHGRAFDASGAESFVCVARYPDLVSSVATPGVEIAQDGWLRGGTTTIAQP